MTSLKNATVLITGAGGGFGTQLVQQCLTAGSCLILSDLRLDSIDAVLAPLGAAAQDQVVQRIAADLSTREGCETLHRTISQTPDVLINNAGLACFGRFDEIPSDEWERLMAVNLMAPMRLVSLFAPQMIARRSGHIVNISSLAGWIGTEGLASYSAAKFGLRGFGESIGDELHTFNIQVTTVYPFFSKTPILDSPRYGSLQSAPLPDRMLSAPEDVIRNVIRGIERNQRHVFPDPTARTLHWVKRLFPGLLSLLNRR